MKKLYTTILYLSLVVLGFSSCNDYLDDIPKGSRIPQTLADFEALIRDEYTNHRVDIRQAEILLNDRFITEATLSFYPLDKANYLWDESADRIALNRSDEATYYTGYAGISTFNLIVENALSSTEASEAEQRELWAQAKVLRAMSYFNLVNYYADTYEAGNAADKRSVPLITSADINAPSSQVSILELYDFIVGDIEEAIPYLPRVSQTVLHPDLGTGYALLSRVYLQMANYGEALNYADMALDEHDDLYDWTAYYNDNKAVIEDPDAYVTTPSPMGFDYVENYNFRHGSLSRIATENNILTDRADRFEPGDARFLSRWKVRTVGAETFYNSTLSGYFNYGGITTVEVYLIKAECLARTGQTGNAMDMLNRVRKTRILPDVYQDLEATGEAGAIEAIMNTKRNELILTIIPFCDARRLNAEGIYTVGFTKTYNGESYALTPDSHLWTMPFPQGATDNPGNGTIVQNVNK
ncbi:SusD family protein [Sinomicrobium oceani]|uniref:SusD family protein n=1 Tax=Sinomicrobium oceani TaxID=1150368 RepID=A0A1K1M4U2_9FLAO|nr:RagB/SusD family nutrient uptake outer membrane protein [Sinomicrobium oceani]SFW18087.1 SusD family protein [Sinomicrobium oceani]